MAVFFIGCLEASDAFRISREGGLGNKGELAQMQNVGSAELTLHFFLQFCLKPVQLRK